MLSRRTTRSVEIDTYLVSHARSASAGMTLLELMVACSILIILATVAMPLERNAVKRHKEADLRYDLRQMRDAIDRYKDAADKNLFQVQAGTEGYPPDLDTLKTGVDLTGGAGSTGGVNLFPSTTAGTSGSGSSQQPRKIHFLRDIPKDPMTGNSDWVLRSVQDDPDSTSWGGQDVFDVHSASTDTALDGTKYSDW